MVEGSFFMLKTQKQQAKNIVLQKKIKNDCILLCISSEPPKKMKL